MIKTIATTRFNDETYQQNKIYKTKIKHSGTIYGIPRKIKDKIPLGSCIYVIEMNNSKNKIEGIGLIKNEQVLDKNYRLYEERDYNRYIYKGSKHISIEEIKDVYFNKVIEVLEYCCFKGNRHYKRGQGITEISDWMLYNKHNVDFIKIFDDIFKAKYNTNIHVISNKLI
jgi:hypothetical protein